MGKSIGNVASARNAIFIDTVFLQDRGCNGSRNILKGAGAGIFVIPVGENGNIHTVILESKIFKKFPTVDRDNPFAFGNNVVPVVEREIIEIMEQGIRMTGPVIDQVREFEVIV